MTVKAWLEGNPIDLAALADLLPLGDVRVVCGEAKDRYFLAAPEIDNPPNPGRFNEPAESLLARLNGLGRTRDTSFRPVSLSGLYDDHTGGVHVFPQTARIEIRSGLATVLVTPMLSRCPLRRHRGRTVSRWPPPIPMSPRCWKSWAALNRSIGLRCTRCTKSFARQ